MNSLSHVLLLIAILLLPPAAGFAQTAPDAEPTDEAIAVGDSAPNDAAIQTRLSNLLDEFGGYADVQVTVTEGIVTLTGDVIDNAAQDQLSELVNRVDGVIAITDNTRVSGTLEERLAPAAERIIDRIQNLLTNVPIFLVAAAAFLVIAVSGWLLTTRITLWNRIAPNRFIGDIYRAVARIAFVLLGVVLALDILNATALIGAVLGAAGVVGLALGFAVRDTVENFIASILLSLRQPFRPNDFVDVQGDMGTVARLTSRATILISPEGNHIRIPNATVFKGRIVNYTRDPQRRFDFELGVDADADQTAALTTAVDALNSLPFVLKTPEVGAWVKEVGDSNVVLTFTGWVDQREVSFPKARGEAIRTAKNALEAAGFGLPEPIYRVRLDDRNLGQSLQGGQLGPMEPAPQPARAKAQTATEKPLPSELDPTRTEAAQEQAANRERSEARDEENLLDPQRQGE